MGRSAVARQGQRKGDFLAGKYLLEDCLGIGGMGEVYRATNVSLGRAVAIKLLSPEFVHIEDDVLRFLREARAAAAVRHTNVVDVLDVARDDDGTPFIVQELLSGEDLEHHLKAKGGRLSFIEALDIMIPVADAVAAAHARDVVHRDLKPANIFLAKERDKITPKVLDFGACLFPTIAERTAKEVRMLIGTPHYMAPEQIVSKADVGARSDVWALGIILYELIVGETPFEADSAKAVMELVKTREVPPLRKHAKDAPPELEELIEQCTKRDRLARLADAGVVHARMAAVRASMDRKNAPSSRRRAEPPVDARVEESEPVLRPAKPAAAKLPNRALLTLSSPGSEPPPSPDVPASTERRRTPVPPPPPSSSSDRLPPSSLGRIEIKKVARPATPIDPRPPPGRALLKDKLDLDPISPRARENRSSADNRETVRADPSEPAPLALSAPEPVREPSAPPPERSSTQDESSMPPVLDPRAAARTAPKIPAADPPPQDILDALEKSDPFAELELDPPPKEEEKKRAVPAAELSASRIESTAQASSAAAKTEELTASRIEARPPEGAPAPMGKLVAAAVLPAAASAMVLRFVPAIGGPIGRALRGESTLGSGVLAVVALLAAAALCTRSLIGARTRWLIVGAVGSVLFGITMIIVTFSASEAAELGIPSQASGLPTFVAPIAPIALAIASLLQAKADWARTYTRGDAVRSAAFAGLMIFAALVLSPIGAVRTPSAGAAGAPRSVPSG